MTTPSPADAAPTRVLTVCLGNICRSPTAEAALVEAAAAAEFPLEVASAGTGDWHLGHPPNADMRAAAAADGLELRGTAQKVDADLLRWADLVLVMDRSNLTDVKRLAEQERIDTPVVLFRSFDPERTEHADGKYEPDEVPDPYGGAAEGFSYVVRVCRRTARALVATWARASGGPDR